MLWTLHGNDIGDLGQGLETAALKIEFVINNLYKSYKLTKSDFSDDMDPLGLIKRAFWPLSKDFTCTNIAWNY